MAEIWRDIPGAKGYQASDLGRVRSKYRILKPGIRPDGHTVVCAGLLGHIYTHKAVMLAFVGERPRNMVTLHLNHKPADNRLFNLRYGTVSENLKMDFAAGARCHIGEKAPAAKLTNAEVLTIQTSTCSAIDLAEIFGVTPRHIRFLRSKHVASSFLTGMKPPTQGENSMAKKPALTAAEVKAQKSSLVTLLKQQKADLQPHVEAAKTADKALAAAKKEADKAVATAQKSAVAAAAKLAKAQAAAAKGAEKINAKLAALSPAAPAAA